MIKDILAIALIATLAGCAAPASYTTASMVDYDKDTTYAVVDTPDGFDLTVNYGRYQFIPESPAVATACKAALTSIAWDVAKRRGREIDPVNEQRIRISMGRNGFSGITTCSANVPAAWKK
ncbi:hypothetical protein [Janthinobacterium sp. CG_S6]|uniref:hypothetical protein n=1 Tax=Janthinobacterium sp. CG_S6 TaxID=3071707 RepID=UPI002DFB31A6|nr:hypothetical protein [Janthinobacterium sp. CG_S6]